MSMQVSSERSIDIAEINARLERDEDPRECYRILSESIRRCRERGEGVSEDALRLERSLIAECNAQSQGR
ncbi:MAG: hypothetical protein KDJ37_02940 [Hyphomicrobiaceae bacterium]|nr:hypothetical protein [Hyphomicrobiaceae bacterium]